MKNKCTKFRNYRPYTAKSLGTWKMFDNPTDNHTDIEVPLYYKLRFTKLIKPIGQLSDEPWKFFGYTVISKKKIPFLFKELKREISLCTISLSWFKISTMYLYIKLLIMDKHNVWFQKRSYNQISFFNKSFHLITTAAGKKKTLTHWLQLHQWSSSKEKKEQPMAWHMLGTKAVA